jgi:hypothetical protein
MSLVQWTRISDLSECFNSVLILFKVVHSILFQLARKKDVYVDFFINFYLVNSGLTINR